MTKVTHVRILRIPWPRVFDDGFTLATPGTLGDSRAPQGVSRGPTIPFWLNFGRWFPGVSANFALNHPKTVTDLSRCLPTNLRLQTRRRGEARLVPTVSPVTYDVVIPSTIYNIESAIRWLQNRCGKINIWFHEDGAEIQDAYLHVPRSTMPWRAGAGGRQRSH